MNIQDVNIRPVSNDLQEKLQNRIDRKTKPVGALGRLEEIALQCGLIQNTVTPEIKVPVFFVFASDNGIADAGVSPYPKEVTMQMVMNFLRGGAAINVFCRQNEIGLFVVDAGVNYDFDGKYPVLIDYKVDYGTENILEKPAMTKLQCEKAINNGINVIQRYLPAESTIVGFGEMGIGNTSTSALIMSNLCDLPIEDCVGRGTGCDDEKLDMKIALLKKACEKHGKMSDVYDALSTYGGYDIAMMSGAMLKSASLGKIILVDGFIASVAALIAGRINPNSKGYFIFTHKSGEHGHSKLLEYLNEKPLLDLGMRLGEGTGAAVALPLVKSAVSFLKNMASFEDAGVSDKL